jgi:hypothetical protein
VTELGNKTKATVQAKNINKICVEEKKGKGDETNDSENEMSDKEEETADGRVGMEGTSGSTHPALGSAQRQIEMEGDDSEEDEDDDESDEDLENIGMRKVSRWVRLSRCI